MVSERGEGLYWTPLGGNDSLDIRANCHVFESVSNENGKTARDYLIVDIGADEVGETSVLNTFSAVVPDLSDFLDVSGKNPPVNKAAGIFLTHAHEDHMGGIVRYLAAGIKLPPIYASDFTLAMLKKELVSQDVPLSVLPEVHTVKAGEKIKVGAFTLEPVRAPHSIPGCLGVKISDKNGSIYHSGDIKADSTSYLGEPLDEAHLKRIGEEGVDLMLFDAVAADKPGFARSERDICASYAELFEKYGDRQIVSLIKSSHTERFATVLKAAEKAGKNVIIQGGSEMQFHLAGLKEGGISLHDIAPSIKILNHTSPEARRLSPETTVILSSGIEGVEEAPFFKTLRGEKGYLPLAPDAVIIAPLSKRNGENFKNKLYSYEGTQGFSFIGTKDCPGIDGSGHALRGDFLFIAGAVRPKMIVPIHCKAQKANKFNKMAASMFNTFPLQIKNGETLKVRNGKMILEGRRNTPRLAFVQSGQTRGMRFLSPAERGEGKNGGKNSLSAAASKRKNVNVTALLACRRLRKQQ